MRSLIPSEEAETFVRIQSIATCDPVMARPILGTRIQMQNHIINEVVYIQQGWQGRIYVPFGFLPCNCWYKLFAVVASVVFLMLCVKATI